MLYSTWRISLDRIKQQNQLVAGQTTPMSLIPSQVLCRTFSSVLKKTKSLEQLDLVFRECASLGTPLAYTYWDHDYCVRNPDLNGLLDLRKVSTRLLQTSAPVFQRLRYLYLSLSTGDPHLLTVFARLDALRHLLLNYVVLLPSGGLWETVLQYIAQHLRLNRIELRALEDVQGQKPRLLLDPQAPEWTANPTHTERYIAYEDAIVRFTLRLSHICPPLGPSQYLEQCFKSMKT